MSTKAGGICCAKKRAYQRAVENAFSRIVLVILPGGRVYADVNTTLEDNLERENLLSDEGLLKVGGISKRYLKLFFLKKHSEILMFHLYERSTWYNYMP